MAEIEVKRFYNEKEFCELMGVSRKTAFKWRKTKVVGFTRSPNGTIRYRQSDIDEYERRYGVRPRRAA